MTTCEEHAVYAQSVHDELLRLIRELCAIPAPSHHEEKRAEFCKTWFEANGFSDVSIDGALNVLAPVNVAPGAPLAVVMAHTDTVFPDTEPMPFTENDGYFASPGVVDDTANLAVMMVCARYYKDHLPPDAPGILFVANSGEEGLGNLKGCRKIVEDFGPRIREFVSLDSASMKTAVTRAVGSHRYRVAVRTEGGHSFNAFGNRNAIHVLSSMIAMLYTVKVPQRGDSKTTYNVGTVSGGTSVNTIAQNAEMLYEYRSDDRACLAAMQEIFEKSVAAFRATGVTVEVEKIGDRPCSRDVDPARMEALCNKVRGAVGTVLGEEVVERPGSTDCNIPLACGIPAVCFGVCRGSGCHTREEKLEIGSLYDGCRLLLDFLNRL